MTILPSSGVNVSAAEARNAVAWSAVRSVANPTLGNTESQGSGFKVGPRYPNDLNVSARGTQNARVNTLICTRSRASSGDVLALMATTICSPSHTSAFAVRAPMTSTPANVAKVIISLHINLMAGASQHES